MRHGIDYGIKNPYGTGPKRKVYRVKFIVFSFQGQSSEDCQHPAKDRSQPGQRSGAQGVSSASLPGVPQVRLPAEEQVGVRRLQVGHRRLCGVAGSGRAAKSEIFAKAAEVEGGSEEQE